MKNLLWLLLLVPAVSLAQETYCDMTLTSETHYNDKVMAKSSIVYYGLPKAAVAEINKMGMKVVDVGSKGQDKGGPYKVIFGNSDTCGGTGGVELRGMMAQGVTKTFRASSKMGDDLLKIAEKETANNGKKKAWGKQ